jgi:hypothetical protein
MGGEVEGFEIRERAPERLPDTDPANVVPDHANVLAQCPEEARFL